MRKISLFLVAAMLVSLLTGCMGTPVVYYTDCTCPADSHTAVDPTEPAADNDVTPVEGAVKTGLYIGTDISASKSATAEENGAAAYDVTIAAVTVDDNGVIVSCTIDSIKSEVTFDATGALTSDTAAEVLTKNELGENYGMVAWGGAVAEWNEQAAALAAYAVGKTVEELKNGAVGETGYAVDADLATTATIYLGGYVSAIEAAVANAQHLGAQAADELRLAIIPGVSSSKAADAENNGTAQLDVDVTALTVKDGVITSCTIDSLQAKVSFDAAGAVTTDLTAPVATKNELGENYGMVAWGGAIAEWNEQAASFAQYVTGKTASEVAGIAVSETTAPTDADLAATVTIAVGGFQALIAKAMQ